MLGIINLSLHDKESSRYTFLKHLEDVTQQSVSILFRILTQVGHADQRNEETNKFNITFSQIL